MRFEANVMLSITTGRLLCDFPDVHQALTHLSGQPLMTHMLPTAGKRCEPYLRERWPELFSKEVIRLVEIACENKDGDGLDWSRVTEELIQRGLVEKTYEVLPIDFDSPPVSFEDGLPGDLEKVMVLLP